MAELLNDTRLNLAKTTNYKLNLSALPGITFWATTASIPTISSNEVPIPHPTLGNQYIPSSTQMRAPLMLTFLIDQDFKNYFELFGLMEKASSADVKKREPDAFAMRSTGSLHILTNNKNASSTVFTFHNIFPTILGEVQFNNESNEPLITDVTLQFDYMTMENSFE